MTSSREIIRFDCSGTDLHYQQATLIQVIKREGNSITSAFVLDLKRLNAEPTQLHFERYHQVGNLLFRSLPLNHEAIVVDGAFERVGSKAKLLIFYFWRTGYRAEITVDDLLVRLPCQIHD